MFSDRAIAKLIKCGEAAPFSLWGKVGRKENIYKNQNIRFLQKPSPRPSPRGRGSFAIASEITIINMIFVASFYILQLTCLTLLTFARNCV
ncbi:MAG: hypothetical protein WCJ33_01485 [Pseudomonadota bacterium]